MYVGTTIWNLLTFMSIIHAKDSKHRIYARGENATVHISQLEINLPKVIEITFCGYTSKTLVTNVMLYEKKKGNNDTVSINANYNGRITMIDMNGSSLSFLLLNVDFMDSGNFIVSQDSQMKGATDIFVARQQLIPDNMEHVVLLFTCNITDTSLITVELMIAKVCHPVVKYNVIQKNCTEVGTLYENRIERCVLNGTHLLITIRKPNIHDMGMYVAWDYNNILLDSLYLHIRETIKSSQHGSGDAYSTTAFVPSLFSSDSENYRFEWCLSAVVVVFLATGLIINVVVRHQQRTMPNTKSCNQKHLDAKRVIAHSSRNCIPFSNEIRTRLPENNSLANLSGFSHGETEEKDIINKKYLYAQINDCRKSVVNNFQLNLIPKSLDESIQSVPTYEYDHLDDYIEQEPEIQEHQSMDLPDLERHGHTKYYDFTDKDSNIA